MSPEPGGLLTNDMHEAFTGTEPLQKLQRPLWNNKSLCILEPPTADKDATINTKKKNAFYLLPSFLVTYHFFPIRRTCLEASWQRSLGYCLHRVPTLSDTQQSMEGRNGADEKRQMIGNKPTP